MIKKALVWMSLLSVNLYAQNPILPPGVYMADPSAHVWEKGGLYIYGSVDESRDYYCSKRYHVLFSENLKDWRLKKNSFSTDEVPYSDKMLYAPDCQFKGGIYYLYYCLSDRKNPEGVAESKHPEGPFKEGKKIDLHGYEQIDPCVFLDGDGQAYYVWGQFTAKMARLKPNMMEIEEGSVQDKVLTEEAHFFHEGVHMVKRNGVYYLIYAHMGRADKPTCLGYAMSSSPMGPYRYGGVIIDNDDCDPRVWNNHGSIVEYQGQWYVFYHRSTHGSNVMRKICVEPIGFDDDGKIKEVEMTSQGAGGPLDAFVRIEAERACLLAGNVRIQGCEENNEELGKIRNRDRAAFKYLDFKEGAAQVEIRARAVGAKGKVVLALDRPWKKSVGQVEITQKDGWRLFTAEVEKITGVHCLWLRFGVEKGGEMAVDWVKFSNTKKKE